MGKKNNVVVMTAVKYPNEEDRYEAYEYGIASWKKWCDARGYRLFVLDTPIFDLKLIKPNFFRYWAFELLEANNIEYDQILLSDADCIIHPECEDFFELTENKYTVTAANCNYDWVCRSMENYSYYIFDNFKFDIFKYFNAGFQVINKTHRPIIDEFINFYLKNRKECRWVEETFGVGNDQPLINFIVHQHKDLELKYLPYKFCMVDMNAKELITESMLYTKIEGIYQFNCGVPNSPAYWCKKTYEYFYGVLNDNIT